MENDLRDEKAQVVEQDAARHVEHIGHQSGLLNRPLVQNALAGVIVCLGPGVFVALTVLGAGGQQASSVTMASITNSTFYGVCAVVSLISGPIVAAFGPRACLFLGAFGYPFYVGGLWYFDARAELWFPVLGGVVGGACASLLSTASAYIAYSYADERWKGTFIAGQWAVLSFGSTFAAIVGFGINYHASLVHVPISVYIVFICMMASSALIVLFGIRSSQSVRRGDGTKLAKFSRLNQGMSKIAQCGHELKLQAGLLKDPSFLAMIIPLFGCECPIMLTSTLNPLFFDIRTRSLNSLLFNAVSIPGSALIAFVLDYEKIGNRMKRGLWAVLVSGVTAIAGWVGMAMWIDKHPLNPLEPPLWDWKSEPFAAFCIWNLLLGIDLAIYQITAQWILASLTNKPNRLAWYAGVVKALLAAGVAVSFGCESAGTIPQTTIVAWQATVQVVGLGCMVFVCVKYIRDTNYARETEIVVPPKAIQEELHVVVNETEDEESLDDEKMPRRRHMAV